MNIEQDKIELIHDFFTSIHGDQHQFLKHDEELDELLQANVNFKNMPNHENFIALLDELADVVILTLQIGKCRYNVNFDVLDCIINNKIERTVKIINLMNKTGKDYDEIRRMI